VKFKSIIVTAALALSLTAPSFSQNIAATSGNETRKVVRRVAPAYPDLAKRMGVSGAVKLELTVSASGKVTEAKVLGGHPILAGAAQQVVQNWTFEPGASSTELVVINFTL
jgi:TonB family protein